MRDTDKYPVEPSYSVFDDLQAPMLNPIVT